MIPASVMSKFCIGEHRKNPSPDHKTCIFGKGNSRISHNVQVSCKHKVGD